MDSLIAWSWHNMKKVIRSYFVAALCLAPFGVAYALLSRVGWGKPWVVLILLTAGLTCVHFAWTAFERPHKSLIGASLIVNAEPEMEFYPRVLRVSGEAVVGNRYYEGRRAAGSSFQHQGLVTSVARIVVQVPR